MNLFWIILAAFIGSLVSGTVNWLSSTEAFSMRQFLASVLRGLISAAVMGAGFSFSGTLTPMDIVAAFLSGAGVDAIGNRVAKSIAIRRGKRWI